LKTYGIDKDMLLEYANAGAYFKARCWERVLRFSDQC
jgi:hypothetical protein